MATKVIMPQGGQDITEGTVVNWLKAEGETVKKLLMKLLLKLHKDQITELELLLDKS